MLASEMSGLLSHYILSVLTFLFYLSMAVQSGLIIMLNFQHSTMEMYPSIGTFRKMLAINEKYMQAEYGMCSRNRMGSEHLELHLWFGIGSLFDIWKFDFSTPTCLPLYGRNTAHVFFIFLVRIYFYVQVVIPLLDIL